jgi:hypothetical protein
VFPKTTFFQVVLLFFPITLVLNLNLETSVFSPDDRLNRDFYEAVKEEIEPENTIMIYHILNWTWPFQESQEQIKASVAQFDSHNSVLSDIIITKTTELENPEIIKLYDTIAYHQPSTHIAFKRKELLDRSHINETEPIDARGNLLYAEIAKIKSDEFAGKNIQVTMSGHLKTFVPKNKLQLVVQSFNPNGEQERYLYYSFETTYQGELINDDFLHHFIIENVSPKEKEIKVYIWNRALQLIELTDANCTLFELKNSKE